MLTVPIVAAVSLIVASRTARPSGRTAAGCLVGTVKNQSRPILHDQVGEIERVRRPSTKGASRRTSMAPRAETTKSFGRNVHSTRTPATRIASICRGCCDHRPNRDPGTVMCAGACAIDRRSTPARLARRAGTTDPSLWNGSTWASAGSFLTVRGRCRSWYQKNADQAGLAFRGKSK